ncbi:MAG: DUF5682 family protein [Anaerolineae bacterium]|nr:DUF5682 family protein [Anaerolineae bacterium]
MQDSIHLFGIRHHGPGSARSLLEALSALQPDCILVEGPPDAQDVLPLALHAEMAPPVALLVYARDDLHRAAFFPFAAFSPEWQALRFGLERGVAVRLMDLPQAHALAMVGQVSNLTAAATPAQEDVELETRPTGEEAPEVRIDPLQLVAEAAGFQDGERWWEQLVEQRRDSAGVFQAILEVMRALREELAAQALPHTLLREAYMRRLLRQSVAEAYRRIAVVCGAWHTPALEPDRMPPPSHDEALLKRLPKMPVVATWVPWTHSRLAVASGYGAGITSPGWYAHLWAQREEPVTTWLARVAHLLRGKDLTASPAQIIDAVRLAETLAALRGRPAPALAELNEAAVAVLCHGDSTPLALIQRELIVGDTMGVVPGETLQVPLQRDLEQTQKRLRMKPSAGEKVLKLDLRKPLHLARSQLLYRLQLLEIPWGEQQQGVRQRGTFNEVWKLRWEPELNVRLIEKSVWGNSVVQAATAYSRQRAADASDLPTLSALTHLVLLADLPDAATPVLARLQELSALSGDVALLMQSLPPLADVLLYGNVHQSDAALAAEIVDSLIVRICVGLPPATLHLDDSAAGELFPLLLSFHAVVQLLDNAEHTARWHELLQKIVGQEAVHPLLRGRACRILLDAGLLDAAEAVRRLRLAIAAAVEPAHAAAWLEGFLRGSGAVLLHHERLLQTLDRWLLSLSEPAFRALLPLLRRTFRTFSPPERAQIGRLLARAPGTTAATSTAATASNLDPERAALILPTLATLLGVTFTEK